MGVTFQGCPGSFPGIKTSLHEQSHSSLFHLHVGLSTQKRHFKEELGVVISQKQADGYYHPVAYGSGALTAHEKNYHSTKLEFLALNGPSQNILRNTCTNPP